MPGNGMPAEYPALEHEPGWVAGSAVQIRGVGFASVPLPPDTAGASARRMEISGPDATHLQLMAWHSQTRGD
jgi:hypothetical protein